MPDWQLNIGLYSGMGGVVILHLLIRFYPPFYIAVTWVFFAISAICVAIGRYTIKCLKCNEKLVPINPNFSMHILDKIKLCLYCGLDLDSDVNN